MSEVPQEKQAQRAAHLIVHMEWESPQVTDEDKKKLLMDTEKLKNFFESLALWETSNGLMSLKTGESPKVSVMRIIKEMKAFRESYGIKAPDKFS